MPQTKTKRKGITGPRFHFFPLYRVDFSELFWGDPGQPHRGTGNVHTEGSDCFLWWHLSKLLSFSHDITFTTVGCEPF